MSATHGMNESRVVLLKQEDPFWMVDAAIEDGKLSICSGDAHREWYVIVEADQRERLLQALRSRGGDQPRPGDTPDRETLDLLAQTFSGRTGLLEEIKALLEQAAIPYRTTVW